MDKIDRAEVLKYEARVREIDSKVEVEKAARARAEGQSDKFKEQVVTLEQVSLFRWHLQISNSPQFSFILTPDKSS